MANPESFPDLTKVHEKLLSRNWMFFKYFKIVTHIRGPTLSNKSSISHTETDVARSVHGYTRFCLSSAPNRGTIEIDTTQLLKGTLKHSFSPGLIVGGDIGLSEKAKYSLYVESMQPSIRGKLSVSSTPSLSLSAVAQYSSVGVASELSFSPCSSRFTTYNAILYWFTDNYRLLVKHSSLDEFSYQLGDLTCMGYYDYSPTTKFAGSLNYGNSPTVQAAMQTALSESKTLKLRCDSESTLCISMKDKLSSYLTLISTSRFNICAFYKEASPIVSFGLTLKINSEE